MLRRKKSDHSCDRKSSLVNRKKLQYDIIERYIKKEFYKKLKAEGLEQELSDKAKLKQKLNVLQNVDRFSIEVSYLELSIFKEVFKTSSNIMDPSPKIFWDNPHNRYNNYFKQNITLILILTKT